MKSTFAEFAEALSNPLAWLSEHDRHEKQLEVFDEEESEVVGGPHSFLQLSNNGTVPISVVCQAIIIF